MQGLGPAYFANLSLCLQSPIFGLSFPLHLFIRKGLDDCLTAGFISLEQFTCTLAQLQMKG